MKKKDFEWQFRMGLADGKIVPSYDGDDTTDREGWFITPDMREKLEKILDETQ